MKENVLTFVFMYLNTLMYRENSHTIIHTIPQGSSAGIRAFTSNYHTYRPARPEEIRGGLPSLLH